jgi:hypothetical protein
MSACIDALMVQIMNTFCFKLQEQACVIELVRVVSICTI